MRNVVAYELLTLDGVAEDPDQFMTTRGCDETDEHLGRVIANQDSVLLGRRTYDDWAGGDIGVHGSIALTQALFEADLIDELRLVIAPAVQMRGRRLFERGLPRRLTLIRSEISPGGCLMLDYSLRTGRRRRRVQ